MNPPDQSRLEFRQEVIAARERSALPLVIASADALTHRLGWAALAGVSVLLLAIAIVPITVTRSAPGVAVPQGGFAQVSAPIGGRVRLHVTEGQRVQAGQTLAVVTSNSKADVDGTGTELYALLQAQQELRDRRDASDAAAGITLQGLRQELQDARTNARASAQVAAVQEERAQIASRRLKIVEPLVADRYVTGMEYLALQDHEKASKVEAMDRKLAAREAQSRISTLMVEMREAERAQVAETADMDSQIQRLAADIARTRLNNRREVRASGDGVVVDLSISTGSFVEQSRSLMSIAGSIEPVEVIAYVPGSLRTDIKLGTQATVVLPSLNGERHRIFATVSRISASEVRKSAQPWEPTDIAGFFRVELQLNRQDASAAAPTLWPGQTVGVDLDLPPRTLFQRLIGDAR